MTTYSFESPERCTVGTIGEVGARLFLIQVREGRRLLTVKVEKIQVATLATYLARLVKEMGRPHHLPDDLNLEAELDIDFTVGDVNVMAVEDELRIVLELDELVAEDEEGDSAVISLSREQAAAFAIHATRLVEGGRPPCPLCSLPLDPRGHDCPRTNGHRAPIT
ncbi:MAG: DUF3090 family protein [Actinomycetota bacterium]